MSALDGQSLDGAGPGRPAFVLVGLTLAPGSCASQFGCVECRADALDYG
jgi:hypothetical protein